MPGNSSIQNHSAGLPQAKLKNSFGGQFYAKQDILGEVVVDHKLPLHTMLFKWVFSTNIGI